MDARNMQEILLEMLGNVAEDHLSEFAVSVCAPYQVLWNSAGECPKNFYQVTYKSFHFIAADYVIKRYFPEVLWEHLLQIEESK